MKKIFLSAVVVLSLFSASSCSKSSSANPNQQFVGNYIGTATVIANGSAQPTQPDTLIVTAGTSSTSILLTSNSTQISLGATVSGNTFTYGTQSVSLNGQTLSITSGSGTLSGNTLSGSYSGTYGTASYSTGFVDIKP